MKLLLKLIDLMWEKSLFLTIAFEEDCGSVWLNLESLVGNEVKPVGNVATGSIWWLRHATNGSRAIVVSSEFGHQTLSSRHRWDETSRASELTAVSYNKIIVNLSEIINFEYDEISIGWNQWFIILPSHLASDPLTNVKYWVTTPQSV